MKSNFSSVIRILSYLKELREMQYFFESEVMFDDETENWLINNIKIEIEKTQQYIDELYTGEQWSQKMKDLKDGN